jgi:GT2 family glycosyltransferase
MENSEYHQVKVAAIIVSHNRRELLQRCIDKLQMQTYPLEKILIVDNGSENDVIIYLESIKNIDKRIELLLQENLGGAGGFANGMKHALSEFIDLDFLWLMDDDGYPTESALKELVVASKQFDQSILNSFVVSDSSTKEMSFPFYNGIDKRLDENKDIRYFVNKANFFNGTFIPRSVVDRLGFPIAKLFVKGDELEYFERALIKFRIPLVTVRDSVFVHPPNNTKSCEDVPLGKIWHTYFDLRNMFYSHRFESSLSQAKSIKHLIRLYLYFKYWIQYRNEVLEFQVTNKRLKKKIIFLALWHNIIKNYKLKPKDINNLLNKN